MLAFYCIIYFYPSFTFLCQNVNSINKTLKYLYTVGLKFLKIAIVYNYYSNKAL